jgi:hypothetical protein
VIAALEKVDALPLGVDLLQEYAKRNDGAGHEGVERLTSEFRVISRGPVWYQRYSGMFSMSDSPRGNPSENRDTLPERMDVFRYAEVRAGLVLELTFYIKTDCGSEMEPFLWGIVCEMECTR